MLDKKFKITHSDCLLTIDDLNAELNHLREQNRQLIDGLYATKAIMKLAKALTDQVNSCGYKDDECVLCKSAKKILSKYSPKKK